MKLIYELLALLRKGNEVEAFLDVIYCIEDNYFERFQSLKQKFNFYEYPNFTKKYREYCRQKAEQESNNIEEYNKNKKISMILNILKELNEKTININIINIFFDFLTTKKKIRLYNLPNKDLSKEDEIDENLDQKYINYIIRNNVIQKIELICIIDKYNYIEYINNIIYPYIEDLYFILFPREHFNDLFMFNNLPIDNIYNIFATYFITI